MYWQILIIAEPNDYEVIVERLRKTIPYSNNSDLPFMRNMKGEAHVYSGLLTIDIYPWHGKYHWRGYKPQLIYVPKSIFEDNDLLSYFQCNAIHGAIRPVDDILWKFELKG